MLNSEGCKLYKLCCRLLCLLKSRCDVVLKLRPPAFACSSGKVVVPAEGFETGPVLVEDVIILIRPGYDHMQTDNKMPAMPQMQRETPQHLWSERRRMWGTWTRCFWLARNPLAGSGPGRSACTQTVQILQRAFRSGLGKG